MILQVDTMPARSSRSTHTNYISIETAVPFLAFRDAGFKVSFITETGKSPECDKKMLEGWTQKLLGATAVAVKSYEEMKTHPSYSTPLSWTSPTFSFRDFNMLFFPGGHDKAVRQVIDSPIIQQHLAAYFPSTAKPSNHAVVAICHGVLAVANAKYDSRVSDGEKWAGKSVLYDVTTTTLPGTFESGIFWGTRAVLGDYYKTYGAGSENVETSVSGFC